MMVAELAVSVTFPGPVTVTFTVPPPGAVTVVDVVAELFNAFGSAVVDVTLAVLVSVPAVVVATTMVIVALVVLAIVPTVHVTAVVTPHVPSVETAVWTFAPTGIASVMVTASAGSGPLLVTVIV